MFNGKDYRIFGTVTGFLTYPCLQETEKLLLQLKICRRNLNVVVADNGKKFQILVYFVTGETRSESV